MAEEQRIQEGHRLCANNCGFFGSPATQNLCSKCFTDSRMKQEQASSAKSAVEKSLSVSSSPSTASTPAAPLSPPPLFLPEVAAPTPSLAADARAPADSESAPAPTPQPGRCFACRRRVGLTGFRCRCGSTFCGTHRYPELHECSFDFKTSGREAIARDNPVVRAEKLARI